MSVPEGKNPNWGGKRAGAGRPKVFFKLTRDEVKLLLERLPSARHDSPLGQLAEKLRGFLK